MGSATQPSQSDTVKPVGAHFHNHNPHTDMVMIPIEKIRDNEPFLREARESYYIKKFSALKTMPVTEIEHGLNLAKGQ